MSLSDSRSGPLLGYGFPWFVGVVLLPRPAGSPRFLDCSFPGFIILGRLATSTCVTRPNRICLRYGSQVCLSGFRQQDYSRSLRFSYMRERAIHMVNSFQFTRSARLRLVYPRRQVRQGGRRPHCRGYPQADGAARTDPVKCPLSIKRFCWSSSCVFTRANAAAGSCSPG
jgi:hypothetical protein